MQGKYSYVNPHYDSVFSKIHGSILNQPYQVTMHRDDTRTCQEVSMKCFAEPDKVFPATIRKHDGKGGYVITQWEYKAMFDELNQPSGVLCIGYDITQLVIQKGQLSYAYHAIEERNNILQNIAFAQSHLIRMPLTNILGLIDILSKLQIDPAFKNIADMLGQSALILDTRIKEIIDQTQVSYIKDNSERYK